MSNAWVCEKCNFTADTKEAYTKHKIDHQMNRISDEPPSNPAGEPMEISRKQNKADFNTSNPVPRQENAKGRPSTAKLRLKYVFDGACDCGSAVETIETDVGSDNEKSKSHIVFAYCFKCKKKVRERKVIKL